MSSGSESDDDYVPGEPEQVSEEESADEETELQYENEVECKNKRKATQRSKAKKKVKTESEIKEVINGVDSVEKQEVECLNPEEEKKREDDLWARFLEGTDTKPKPLANEVSPAQSQITEPSKSTQNSTTSKEIKLKDDDKDREKRIFEFAGETIVVENNVIKEKIKTTDSASSVSKLQGPISRGRGGLSGVLNQINKKNQLSTLEKSKLDWETLKKEEGIEEEIVSHNKGKAGYLDRQDFLERTDLRQYEIERNMRLSRRSNR